RTGQHRSPDRQLPGSRHHHARPAGGATRRRAATDRGSEQDPPQGTGHYLPQTAASDSDQATQGGPVTAREARAAALKAARERDSQNKRRRVLEVLDSLQRTGTKITFARVAKEAGVSNWLAYSPGL